jgi:hypothetical protein
MAAGRIHIAIWMRGDWFKLKTQNGTVGCRALRTRLWPSGEFAGIIARSFEGCKLSRPDPNAVLQVPEPPIRAPALQQAGVRASFDDAAPAQNQDLVEILQSDEPMRDQ